VSIDVLFEPIPLFPAYCGYCVGFLCQLGVPLQYSLAAAVFLLANVGVAIVVCCLYRHQTILLSTSSFKLKTFYPDISWIRRRGTYVAYNRTPVIVGIFIFLVAVIIMAVMAIGLMFLHLVYTLQRQLGMPLILLIIPALTMLSGLITDAVPFEICLSAYLMLPFHPIGHNLVLLVVTPAYRRFIWECVTG
ncbi:hypothetical protein PFISCL1PPCAC_14436, partial [Pristionchus fissidentatus]